MIKQLLHTHLGTFLRYSVVGVSGTVLDIGLFALLISTTPLGDTLAGRVIAASLSFVAAVINNYTWNRLWTFKHSSTNMRKQFATFFLVSCGGWALNTLLFAAASLVLPAVVAKMSASAAVLVYNYTANRFWTFRSAKVTH